GSSVSIVLKALAASVGDELGELNFDPNELEELEKRLQTVRSLKRKYGAFAEMHKFREKSAARLEELENADELCEALTAKKNELLKSVYKKGKIMHGIRAVAAHEFSEQIKKELHELGMENADFEVRLSDFPAIENFDKTFTVSGADTAEFYLSPNAGQPLKPLVKIISGGEMSRFMLALKVIAGAADDIPTFVFDEIDVGISGTIGQVVAKKLATISRKHQILCVTHLPQIASMADKHFYIEKQTVDQNTVTRVTPLSEEGMIGEISRLSGSKGISDESDANARNMKNWCNTFKNALE
ncbi:MAG: DNA repair protein RecN, partial [Clostridiales bacterium]|nr:DNA repair protein RecN [Clostridiales bacterium]